MTLFGSANRILTVTDFRRPIVVRDLYMLHVSHKLLHGIDAKFYTRLPVHHISVNDFDPFSNMPFFNCYP